MKERICMVKNCPLRRQHKETKQLFCIVGETKEGYLMEKVMTVKETDCISRRMEQRRCNHE